MFSYAPYMAGTIVVLGNHLILFLIAVLNSYQFTSLHKIWNKIYAFESKKTKEFYRYLIQLDIHNIPREELQGITITIKFMESLKLCVYPIRIPKSFFKSNAYNHYYDNAARIQFLFIRNVEMGEIQNVSVNHDIKDQEICVTMVTLQNLKQTECYYSLIDRPIQCLPVLDADKIQVFEMLKKDNPIPPSEFTVDTDNSLWLLIGPLNLVLSLSTYFNWHWCEKNILMPDHHQYSRKFIEFQCVQASASQSLLSFLIIVPCAQTFYLILHKLYSGLPSKPYKIYYHTVNALFFIIGDFFAYSTLKSMSPNHWYLVEESLSQIAYNIWSQMAFVSTFFIFFIAFPLRYLCNFVIAEWIFTTDNEYDIVSSEIIKINSDAGF